MRTKYASVALSHKHHTPRQNSTQLRPTKYVGGENNITRFWLVVFVVHAISFNIINFTCCDVAKPHTPAAKHASPDLRASSGNTVSSRTYHAPLQKLATATPTNVVVARRGISFTDFEDEDDDSDDFDDVNDETSSFLAV